MEDDVKLKDNDPGGFESSQAILRQHNKTKTYHLLWKIYFQTEHSVCTAKYCAAQVPGQSKLFPYKDYFLLRKKH